MSTVAELVANAPDASVENTPMATLMEPIRLGRSETKHKKVLVHAENAVGILTVYLQEVYLIPWHRVDSIKIPV
jgi:hypothetical protein